MSLGQNVCRDHLWVRFSKCYDTQVSVKGPSWLSCLHLIGVADAVRCYHCGVGLRNWEPGDNPWLEHAKWYSKCPHILFVKGQSFINKVLNCDLIEEYCAERSTANKEVRSC